MRPRATRRTETEQRIRAARSAVHDENLGRMHARLMSGRHGSGLEIEMETVPARGRLPDDSEAFGRAVRGLDR